MKLKIDGVERELHPAYAPLAHEKLMLEVARAYAKKDGFTRFVLDKIARAYAPRYGLEGEEATFPGLVDALLSRQLLPDLEQVALEVLIDEEGYILFQPYRPADSARTGRLVDLHREQGPGENLCLEAGSAQVVESDSARAVAGA